MLNNIKIGPKLIGGFLIIALITAVIGVIGFTSIDSLASKDRFIYEKKTVPIGLLCTISTKFHQIRVNLERIANESSPTKRDYFSGRIDLHNKLMKEAIAALEPTLVNDEDEKLYKELVEKEKIVDDIIQKTRAILKADNRPDAVSNRVAEAITFLHGDGETAEKKVQGHIEKMIELSIKEANTVSNNNTKIAKSQSLFMRVALAICILLAIILGLFLSFSITGPLQKGVAMIQEMAKGHLKSRLRMTRKDEVGILAKAMDDFSDDLQKNVVATIVKIGEGDLSTNLKPKDNQDEITPAIINTTTALRGLISEAEMLRKAAVDGKLATRGNANNFKGGYKDIVQGVNDCLDAVIGPLNVAADYVNNISKGNIPEKITDNYNGDFNTIKNNLNKCIDAVNKLVADAGMLAQAAIEGKLYTRADASKHQGDFGKIVEGVNDTINSLVGFIDNMPAPAMIINKEFEILFMNKAGASLNNATGEQLAKNKSKCYDHFKTGDCGSGKCACSQAMTQGHEASSETNAHPGMHNLEILYTGVPIKNKEGHIIGAFEVVVDQTAIKQAGRIAKKVADYQEIETKRVTENLVKLSAGDTDIKALSGDADKDTAEAKQKFDIINQALTQCVSAVNFLVADANMLSKAAIEGKLATRADASKHKGDFAKIVEGVNKTLDAVIGPLNVAADYVDNISKGNTPPKITDIYNGDFNTIKNNLNNCIDAIENQADAARRIGNGDLSVKINVRSENDLLSKGLVNVITVLTGLQKELQRLTEASKDGLLSERGKPEQFQGAYAEVVRGVNTMLDAILLPIGEGNRVLGLIRGGNLRERVDIDCKGDHKEMKDAINGVHTWLSELIAYVTNIAKGDLKNAVMDKASSDDQIHEWLMLMKSNINALVTDANMLSVAAVEGKLATRADATKHEGDFRKIVQGVNETLDAVIGPLNVAADYVNNISNGNIPAKITDNYNGDFNTIKNNLNKCIDAVNNLVADATMLSKAAVEGKLATRADATKHEGDFRKIVQGVNETLDAVIGPLNVAADYVNNISNGNIPAKITDNYNGDFNTIKNNLNKCIDAVNKLVADATMLSKAAVEGKLATRADATKHEGDFRMIVQGVNETLDAVIGPLNVAADYVNNISNGNIPAKINDNYNGDFNAIKNNLNKCIDAVNKLVEDAVMLSNAAVEGRLATRADAAKHEGDFRKIVQGVNETLDAVITPVNEAASVLNNIANRDLTARMAGNYNGDLANIKTSLNLAVDNLDKALQQVTEATEQVTSASQQISSGSQNLAQGANEQASSLEEVSSSLEEMSSMTKQNAENANQAKGLSGEADQNAATGAEAMNRMSSAINRIKESSDQTAKIVKTIDEIAMQTNLLALNAAVEAARAGEAGRGFAVVAEEVRNLAQRSAQAAKNTADMISESVKNADDGVKIASEVTSVFGSIANSAKKVNDLIAEIAAASQEQAQGIDQVNNAVAQMDKVTQQNAANSEESASAAEELSSQAEELKTMIDQFTLSHG